MIALGEGLHSGVDMAIYHGNCCPGPSVSGSVLVEMREDRGCPAKALAKHYLSPWRGEDEEDDDGDDTADKAFGTLAHCYVLEGPEAFAERYAVKPPGHDGRTKEGKAWAADNIDRTLITPKQHKTISRMAAALKKNPDTQHAFTEGEAEVTAIVKDPETGIWLKVRPDWLRNPHPSLGRLAINYKTARSASDDALMRQTWDLGYFIGAALCIDVLTMLGEFKPQYAILAQEKKVPFVATLDVISDDYIMAGRMMYRHALRRFANCVEKNEWPGYRSGVGTIHYPPWAERKLADMQSPL